jgi:hypothetical protein
VKDTEIFMSISGEIILKINNTIGFPNPLVFGTKNLGLLIKTSDEDFTAVTLEIALVFSVKHRYDLVQHFPLRLRRP